MKIKSILFVLLTLLSANLIAQAPNLFNYQAVVRAADGTTINDQAVKIKLSVLKGTVSGTVSYSEEHNITTNSFGLVNLQIGAGTVLEGGIDTIMWGVSSYFVKTELDADNGGYVTLGTQQLVSVPYAQHAATAGSLLEPITQNGDTLFFPGGDYTVIQGLGENARGIMKDPRDGQVYATVKIAGEWWMAENLNFYTDTASLYYDNDSLLHANVYGRLYTWYMAMNGDAPSDANPSGVQGICPDGWHLPSYAEWLEVINMYGGENVAQNHLMEEGETLWTAPNNSDNSSGLSIRPGGVANNFSNINIRAYLILPDLIVGIPTIECYYLRVLNSVADKDHQVMEKFYSVRCKKD